MRKRLLSLMASAILLACTATQASAAEVITYPESGIIATEAVSEHSTLRRGFKRDYTKYLEHNVVTYIMEDSNWDIYNDTRVTVTFKSNTGPSKVFLTIYHKEDDTNDWKVGKSGFLYTGDAIACTIPRGNTFKVTATSYEGNNGTATFQVVLS